MPSLIAIAPSLIQFFFSSQSREGQELETTVELKAAAGLDWSTVELNWEAGRENGDAGSDGDAVELQQVM